MHRHIAAALVLVLGCASRPAVPPGTRSAVYRHDGLERNYGIHIPEAYDGITELPLVMALHCYSIDGPEFMRRTGWIDKSDAGGFLLVFPDATGDPSEWNEGIGLNPATGGVDDAGFVSGLLDALLDEYRIDKSRVFVTGHSSGAYLCHGLAAEHAERIAAIGTVAGQGTQEVFDRLSPRSTVAVVHVHALDDPAVPYHGGPVAGVPCPSVPDAMAAWARVNGGDDQPVLLTDGGGLRTLQWNAQGHGDVRLYRLDTGGHGWPVDPHAATDLIWNFFEAQGARGDESPADPE